MRRIASVLAALSCVCSCLSPSAMAAEPISRRDGFLLIWSGIKRPADKTNEKPFTDVKSGDEGFAEITYAKARGLIDDTDTAFHSSADLTQRDALLWLFRTRNVDDITKLTADALPSLLKRYPIAGVTVGAGSGASAIPDRVLRKEDLQSLIQSFTALLTTEVHEVSLYGEELNGHGTAFGETFDMNAMTAAHRTFPANTLVKVTNVANGKSVVVRINDRGPFVKGRDMDLSKGAFISIADRSDGKIKATFERLGDVSLVDAVPGTPKCPNSRVQQRLLARAAKRGVTATQCVLK